MSVNRKLAGVLSLFIVACTGLVDASDVPAGWQSYESREYGFALAYPKKSFTYHSGGLDYLDIKLSSYIPLCDPSTVACFIYEGNEYKGTNFSGASVSVNILRDRRTQKECSQIDTGSDAMREKTINGIHFYYGETAGAALGHWQGGPIYRTLHDGVCFELAAATSSVDAQAIYPPTKQFESQKLDEDLDAIIQTFRFVGPVADGPAWKVYNNSYCGGTFEIPDRDEMVTDTEYSNGKFTSGEISCSSHFEDHGRRYTFSAKVNLQTQDALEAWLKSSDYPRIDRADVVERARYFTKYRAGSYYYIFGQSTLYIFSISDTSGHILNPDGDAIFSHLLRSIKCR